LRGTPSAAWQESVASSSGPDYKNIESQKDLNRLAATVPVMDQLTLPGNHWKLRPVEFFDVTDRANTLVRETEYNLYRQPGFLTGNLLLIDDLTSDYSFFVLKEAPSSAVQLANPGYDFSAKIGSIQTVGAGILPTDLSETDWVRGYGYTLGLGGTTPLETIQTLRRYQDAKRPRRPDRDEMLLINTWGDRSQDKKVGEKFTIAELKQAARLGVTHLQLDDGWQTGRSGNSAFKGGSFTAIHRNPNYWKPNPERFPNGLKPVLDAAKSLGIEIGLWFNPSVDSSFSDWKKDAQTLIGLNQEYGIRTFKIDGVQIGDKAGEVNFRRLIDSVLLATDYRVVFNMDVTAGRRNGYHYFNEYGVLFLENRYTDWGNYYPYWTLRNIWNLSRYVPPQNLQIEFLNKWRNGDKYPAGDAFAPATYSFDYLFAITMMAQPLAWFEATSLPAEAFSTAGLIRRYLSARSDLHAGQIFPIGNEPSGRSWTGFQSIRSPKAGFVLVFREKNDNAEAPVKTWLTAGKRVRFEPVAGTGKAFAATPSADGTVRFALPSPNAFALYRYTVE
ncbi:MAG: alpha-galactosidase, partial [Sphingobacteriaceae bacterium]|nr:alpha-galactosidase [Cytophagaceae bacterium]